MKTWIQSILVWLFAIVSLIIIFLLSIPVWLVSIPFDRRRKVYGGFTNLWGSLYTWVTPFWKVTIKNREEIKKHKVYVFISNHQSLLDILLLSRLFIHFKWVSKSENFTVPILGWVMSMNKDIRLKRENRSSILHMMKEGVKILREGSSLMVFPEGTRSKTGEMRKFKEGAFRLAKEADCPILPIVINGTGDALPKKGFVIRGKHNLVIQVLKEIPVDVVREKEASELKTIAFNEMSVVLHTLRKE